MEYTFLIIKWSENTDIKNFLYSTEGIMANSRNVEIRNKNKREILEKLF